MGRTPSRRVVLSGLAAATAGCLDRGGGGGSYDTGDGSADTWAGDRGDAPPPDPPTGSPPVDPEHDPVTLREAVVSGGVPKDGIPSIDDPTFADAAGGDEFLDPNDVVFGVARGDSAKAYPQHVLVHHEIVNDRLAGEPVAITYCPLTGTAQGFRRGDTTLGVSGNLVNSNLVMYDRAGESWWPQVPATAIDGPHTGATLREFPVTWTRWRRWRERYPETRVLTEDTGHVRDYGSDPYGSYNPRGGYYDSPNTMFSPLREDDRVDAKDVVLGVKAPEGPLAVRKGALRRYGLRAATVGGVEYLVVYDPGLDTGYAYRNPDGRAFEYDDGRAVDADGRAHAPDALPLERALRFDAMWFAWAGFYPSTEVVR